MPIKFNICSVARIAH